MIPATVILIDTGGRNWLGQSTVEAKHKLRGDLLHMQETIHTNPLNEISVTHGQNLISSGRHRNQGSPCSYLN
jgi:hypothetical protein